MKLYKPDGQLLEVHEDSLKYALSIGWTKNKPRSEKPPKKAK